MNPRDKALVVRGSAVIVVLLVLAWAAGGSADAIAGR